jgi:hypothetical protein
MCVCVWIGVKEQRYIESAPQICIVFFAKLLFQWNVLIRDIFNNFKCLFAKNVSIVIRSYSRNTVQLDDLN